MRLLYNFLIQLSYIFLWIAQWFSGKFRKFISGRKRVFSQLEKISPTDKTVWVHCASLGEFEQGLPIMEAIKNEYPGYKLIVTFFSPSGYEIKKDTPVADMVVYLPLDTRTNAKRFVKIVHPSLAVLVKYEFWPNYLAELDRNNIPTLLVSGLFRESQQFFKLRGGFMRKALKTIDHFFLQNQASLELLQTIGIHNATVSGDTRFDRVSHQIEMDNQLGFIEGFVGNDLCLVFGSTWPEDEALFLPYVNQAAEGVKFVIAPHKIDDKLITELRGRIGKNTLRYSEIKQRDLEDYDVMIIDTIGLLSRIYHYADLAYIGGAAGNTGLHNILEAATFGVPIVIGSNFHKFPEAIRLQQLAGLFSVKNSEEFTQITEKLVSDDSFRKQTGMISGHFVNSNTGATETVMNYIRQLHANGFI